MIGWHRTDPAGIGQNISLHFCSISQGFPLCNSSPPLSNMSNTADPGLVCRAQSFIPAAGGIKCCPSQSLTLLPAALHCSKVCSNCGQPWSWRAAGCAGVLTPGPGELQGVLGSSLLVSCGSPGPGLTTPGLQQCLRFNREPWILTNSHKCYAILWSAFIGTIELLMIPHFKYSKF